MTIQSITATREELRFQLDAPVAGERIRVSAFSPALGEEGELCSFAATVAGDHFLMPRRLAGRDGLSLCYTVHDTAGEVGGVRYVSEITESTREIAPPLPKTKKGLHVEADKLDDALALGIGHAVLSVSLGDFLMPYPEGDNTLYYRFERRDFYLRRSMVAETDERIRALTAGGAAVYLILLNAPAWETEVSARFWEEIRHPGCEEDGVLSLPDVMRERGCAYYRAFVTFLTDRYTREDGAYGRVAALTVGNEANTPQLYAYAGSMSCEDYAEQYAAALRMAWQCSASLARGIRVYAAIDCCFAAARDPAARGRSYAGRDFLTSLASICRREGDFPWGVAIAAGDMPPSDTLHALRDFLAGESLLCGAQPRRMLLSEFSIPTDGTESGDAAQASALRHAWEAIASFDTLDAALYASHTDHDAEELRCGLCRADGTLRKIGNSFRTLP